MKKHEQTVVVDVISNNGNDVQVQIAGGMEWVDEDNNWVERGISHEMLYNFSAQDVEAMVYELPAVHGKVIDHVLAEYAINALIGIESATSMCQRYGYQLKISTEETVENLIETYTPEQLAKLFIKNMTSSDLSRFVEALSKEV